jgi:hypothetical protein
MRAVKKTMRRLPEHEREEGMEMSESAEQTFVTLGAPSRLGTGVATAFAASSAEEGTPVYGQIVVCTLMGYACRMSQECDVPADVAAQIEPNLLRDEAGTVDFERLSNDPDHFRQLSEWVADTADEPVTLFALASCTPGTWESFAATATYSLQRNLVENGLAKALLIPVGGMDEIMRLGYIIRVVDEVAGLEPLFKPEQ